VTEFGSLNKSPGKRVLNNLKTICEFSSSKIAHLSNVVRVQIQCQYREMFHFMITACDNNSSSRTSSPNAPQLFYYTSVYCTVILYYVRGCQTLTVLCVFRPYYTERLFNIVYSFVVSQHVQVQAVV